MNRIEKKEGVSKDISMNISSYNDSPLKVPPKDDLERMALKTICSECKNYYKVKKSAHYNTYSDLCKNPNDGNIDPISGHSVTSLSRLNPSGYGCPNFEPQVTTSSKIIKYKKTIANISSIFAIIGSLSISYWFYQFLCWFF